MAEIYNILLIEKDLQVAEDVRRYLRASSGGKEFSVECLEDIQKGRRTIARTQPDILILDANFIDQSNDFNELRDTLAERHIPLLVLSSTNGQELRKKASVAGATDYLLKNKLNYFYLPRIIQSVIRTVKEYNQGTTAHNKLLDEMTEAVIVINATGDVLYRNLSGASLLSDTDILAMLRRYLNLQDKQNTLKSTIEVSGKTYEIVISPIHWQEEHCISIRLLNTEAYLKPALNDRITMIADFIRNCSIPFAMEVNGLLREANEPFTDLLGKEKKDLEGRALTDFIISGSASLQNLLRPAEPNLVKVIKGTGQVSTMQLLRRTLFTGKQEISVSSLTKPEEQTIVSISAHRLMEIASHDLREPIRTTSNYIQLLIDSLKKEGGNKKLLSYTETITAELNRADAMLADLKLLMNIGEKVIKLQKISVLSLIQDTLKQLKSSIDQSDAMVNVSEMPTVIADPDDLKRLLWHLLDNALKFRKADKRPYIEILSAQAGQDWQFCIKDNGIGINPKYHAQIFEPFRRLNRPDEYPGAGNGLCICKHIIEQHKGRIWLESHESFGSSFFFTLPAVHRMM